LAKLMALNFTTASGGLTETFVEGVSKYQNYIERGALLSY
jgi:hypothetical protein